MKKLVLSAAVAAVMLGGQAYAAVPLNGSVPDIAAITAAGVYETFIAGSSAATPFLEEAMRADCTAGSTIYKYSFNGSLSYICEKASTVTAVTQPYLVMHKRDGGGSGNGIAAANGTPMLFNVLSSLSGATACGAAKLNVSTCTGATITQVSAASELNFADIDPAQFASALNGAFPGAAATGSAPVATQVFGVVVNTVLRNALQTAQVASGDLAAGCVGLETEACMPNLTSAQIATIFGGTARMVSWSNLFTGGTAATQNLVDVNSAVKPANTDIHICTRTAGSGTWGTFNIKFENAPCNGGVDEAIQTPTTQTITAESGFAGTKKIVHAMSGSGDVENCLTALNNGATTGSFTMPTMVPALTATNGMRWAIGVMGVERNSDGALPYRFVKIDGVAPSAHNVVEGKYKFWAELVQVGAAPTDVLAQDLLKQLTDPTKIANLNVVQTWEVGAPLVNGTADKTGFLGIAKNPVSTMLPTYKTVINGLLGAAYDAARPVNPYTHGTSTGASLNHCRVPTIPGGSVAMPIY